MTGPLGPLDEHGMMRNPFGTRWSDRQADELRQKRAAEIKAAVAAHDAETARLEAERERERREAGAARLEAYRVQCETRWQDNGGTAAGFGSAWPALRDEWLKGQLGDRVAADVAQLRRQPLYQI